VGTLKPKLQLKHAQLQKAPGNDVAGREAHSMGEYKLDPLTTDRIREKKKKKKKKKKRNQFPYNLVEAESFRFQG